MPTDCTRWEILFPLITAVPTPFQSKVSPRMVRSVPCRIVAELRPLKSVEPSRLSVFLSFHRLLTCTYSRVTCLFAYVTDIYLRVSPMLLIEWISPSPGLFLTTNHDQTTLPGHLQWHTNPVSHSVVCTAP